MQEPQKWFHTKTLSVPPGLTVGFTLSMQKLQACLCVHVCVCMHTYIYVSGWCTPTHMCVCVHVYVFSHMCNWTVLYSINSEKCVGLEGLAEMRKAIQTLFQEVHLMSSSIWLIPENQEVCLLFLYVPPHFKVLYIWNTHRLPCWLRE